MVVGEAHRLATMLEEQLTIDLEVPAEVTTHLESIQDHSEVHHVEHYTGRRLVLVTSLWIAGSGVGIE